MKPNLMKHIVAGTLLLTALSACNPTIRIEHQWECPSDLAEAYDGIVIPCNIAPLNFRLPHESQQPEALVLSAGTRSLTVFRNGDDFIPDLKEWKRLLAEAKGKEIRAEHCVETEQGWTAYPPFVLTVADEPIDPYLVYRLIPPGYEKWNEMSICQRNLETFEETTLLANKQLGNNCINCHSFRSNTPEQLSLHLRDKHAGTLLVNNGTVTKLDTKTDRTLSSLVYPYWHPGGKFIAYSVNNTKQLFHTHHTNRIEVLDTASDVVVYDIERNELLTAPSLFDPDHWETFPTFSPDGTKLYFCSAQAQTLPADYDRVRYHLCSIDFDAEHRTFGETVDTLFQAEANARSVSFPRVSPDGRFLLVTLSDFGTFSIWHQEADLWLFDLEKREWRAATEWNSASVESYHCWSSNGRWVVFSSRRDDGLYTRPYIAHLDAEGRPGKPFLLPQRESGFYARQMFSYNIPELLKAPVSVSNRELVGKALSDDIQKVGGLRP